MSELQTSTPASAVASGSEPTASRTAPSTLRTCLVVSSSARQARHFVNAAQQQHWSTVVCRNADDATRQATRNRVQLAFVDLQSASQAEAPSLRMLIELLARQKEPLLAVCGRPNDHRDELWARQLGVWMYLPGIDDQSDVGIVCGQARSIVEKLEGQPHERQPAKVNGRAHTRP